MSVHVPQGYKQTEVGVIPEDWKVASLQDICAFKITYGIVQCGPHIDNGVPYIRVSDMENRELSIESMLRTSHEIAKSFSRSRVDLNDIVYALRGKIGEVRKVNKDVVGANLTQGTARISLKKEFDSEYILWALRSSNSEDQANSESKGSTFKEITLEKLRRIQVPIPSPNEQQAIAEALSDADALIESLEQLIAKKRQIKQGAMQELLTGQRRLPGFSGEWVQRPLGVLLERLSNGVIYTPTNNINGVMVTRIETISSGCIDFEKTGLARFEKNLNEYKLQSGDILFSHINSLDHIGKVAIFNEEHDLYHGMNLLLLRCGNFLDSDFLYFLLSTEFTRESIRKLARQAVSQASINTTDLKDFKVLIPEKLEQQAIASVLKELNDEVTYLEIKLSKARQIKQAMMQELLTGRIRLI